MQYIFQPGCTPSDAASYGSVIYSINNADMEGPSVCMTWLLMRVSGVMGNYYA